MIEALIIGFFLALSVSVYRIVKRQGHITAQRGKWRAVSRPISAKYVKKGGDEAFTGIAFYLTKRGHDDIKIEPPDTQFCLDPNAENFTEYLMNYRMKAEQVADDLNLNEKLLSS